MLNILVAYPYLDAKSTTLINGLKARGECRFILDSGAFSAFNSGHEIDLKEYTQFVKNREVDFDFAVQLDVVGNKKETIENLKYQLSCGAQVSPVFTRGMDYEYLDQITNKHRLTFCGGLKMGVGAEMRKYGFPYIKKLSNAGRLNKCHLLGIGADEIAKTFRPFSMDTSTSTTTARYGALPLYNGFGKQKWYTRKTLKLERKKAAPLLARLGFKPEVLERLIHSDAAWRATTPKFDIDEDRSLAQNICQVSVLLKNMDVEKNIGVKMFTACTDIHSLTETMGAFKWIKDHNLLEKF